MSKMTEEQVKKKLEELKEQHRKAEEAYKAEIENLLEAAIQRIIETNLVVPHTRRQFNNPNDYNSLAGLKVGFKLATFTDYMILVGLDQVNSDWDPNYVVRISIRSAGNLGIDEEYDLGYFTTSQADKVIKELMLKAYMVDKLDSDPDYYNKFKELYVKGIV